MPMKIGKGILFIACALFCAAWTDPSEDLLDTSEPRLDILEATFALNAENLTARFELNPAACLQSDLAELTGFVDLDVDADPLTGRMSHFEEFGLMPFPVMGVDYYLAIYADAGLAELVDCSSEPEVTVDFYDVTVDGFSVRFSVPRTAFESAPGGRLPFPFTAVAFINNYAGPIDRVPNGGAPILIRAGDFDGDGWVDQSDLPVLIDCRSGPMISWATPECAVADLDEDGDVDQDDFGVFQRNVTGP